MAAASSSGLDLGRGEEAAERGALQCDRLAQRGRHLEGQGVLGGGAVDEDRRVEVLMALDEPGERRPFERGGVQVRCLRERWLLRRGRVPGCRARRRGRRRCRRRRRRARRGVQGAADRRRRLRRSSPRPPRPDRRGIRRWRGRDLAATPGWVLRRRSARQAIDEQLSFERTCDVVDPGRPLHLGRLGGGGARLRRSRHERCGRR